jgi:hypothetical protein
VNEYESALQQWRSTQDAAAPAKLGFAKRSSKHLEALERVRQWTRERFKLPDEATILVSELACAIPGCPPLETVVAFWTADATRHHFKLLKPVAQVVHDDLPFAWLMDSLVLPEGFVIVADFRSAPRPFRLH